MGKLIDLTGERFGHLTVIERANCDSKWPRWICKCDCGNIKDFDGHSLRRGNSRSCGCGITRIIHGMSYSKLYKVYDGMKSRCYKKSNPRYKNYGERGIRICDEWLGKDGRNQFVKWALNHGYKEGLSIDRIDCNGNYTPENCRWTTNSVQMFNRQKRKSRLGLRGVYYIPEKRKYRAEIMFNCEKFYLGYYENKDEANKVRKEAELKYYGQVLD